MGIEYYIYSVLIATGVVGGWNLIKHIMDVNTFYRKLEDLFIAYYKKYPDEDPYYFSGVVVTRFYAWTTFWEKDFNNFILNPELLKELYTGARQYIKEEEERREKHSTELDLECPWCDNKNQDDFLWYETEPEEGLGTIQCQVCFASCPLGTFDECVDSMAPYTCEEHACSNHN